MLAGTIALQAQVNLPPPPVVDDAPAREKEAYGGTAGPPPPIDISASLAESIVTKGSTVTMKIELSWSAPADKPVPTLGFDFPEPPSARGLTLYANSMRTVTELFGNTLQVKRTYKYGFHADEIMKTEISPVKIKYYRLGSDQKKELSTQPLQLNIIQASKGPGRWLRHPAVIVLLALIALAATAALVVPPFMKRRKKEKPIEPVLSVYDDARQSLERASRLRMAGEYEDYLAALHNAVIAFLEDELDMKLKNRPVEKKARAVGEKLGGDWEEKTLELERLCDRVRFAGYKPSPGELDRAAGIASELVDAVEQMSSKTLDSEEKLLEKDNASGDDRRS